MHNWSVIPILLVFFLCGCAQTVNFKTTPDDAQLEVKGKNLGEVPADGKKVELRTGFAPVPVALILPDGTRHEGEIERTETNGWILAAGLAGAGLCVPALCGVGLWIANPLAPLACLAACTGGGCGAGYAFLAQTVTFWTAPMGALGACLGLSPLAMAAFAGEIPEEVMVKAPTTDAILEKREEMAF
jgi:hypothetical protein